MINLQNYTTDEIDLLYSVVEDAVKNNKPVDLFKIDGIIKAGDFFLYGNAANGLVFQFNGLKWIENGEIYNCLIQPQIRFNEHQHSVCSLQAASWTLSSSYYV